jgi:putative ABC transport system permease protein
MAADLVRDVRIALRRLLQRPGFTAAALAILALGIGANTVVFTIVNAWFLRPLPFGERSPRVVTLHATHATQAEDWGDSPVAYDDLLDLRAEGRTFAAVGGHVGRNFSLALSGDSERVNGGSVTPDLFPLLGVAPVLGRGFREDEAQPPGQESVVLLSHGLWQRRFGGDQGILGRPVHLNGRALTVVGVMPPGFRFPERDDLWVPFRTEGGRRDRRFVDAVGLLAPGVSVAQAQAEADAVAARIARRQPDSNRGWGLKVLSFRDGVVGDDERALSASLMGAVGFVTLIGCANLANLLLARGSARRREMAVRTALGATRARLVREMLVECLLLGAAGGLLGVYLSRLAVELMVKAWPEELPYWLMLRQDARVLLFAVAVSLLTVAAFGLVPALASSRTELVTGLRDGGRGSSAGRGRRRLDRVLVVGQVALCLALLVGANLMIRSFMALRAAPSGFDEARLLTLRFYLAGDAYDAVEAKAAFFRRAVEALRAVPGVRAAVATTSIPTDDGGSPARVVREGGAALPGEETGASLIAATPELFETLGTGLLAGRAFTDAESADARAGVVIVNRALAARFWPQGDAVGRQVGLVEAGTTAWLRVVGVAPDIQYEEFGEETDQSRLNLFVPYARAGARTMAFIVRSEGRPAQVAAGVRQALRGLDPSLPVYDVRTMAEVRALTTWEQAFFGRLMGGFALAALLLACLGVYALLSFAVSRRTQEIGVRMALGARPRDMASLVLREGAGLAALGAALGLVLAGAVARVLSGVVYAVSATSPVPFLGMAALLAVVALAASLLPAWRASVVEPVRALRHE